MTIPVLKKSSQTKPEALAEGFIVLIHKAADWTSFDVVKKIRNITRVKKVGHAGTLDPFATGLLVIGVGRGTKLLTDLIGRSKTYSACIQFGLQTDTYDRTGKTVKTGDTAMLTEQLVAGAVAGMTGSMEQEPPMFSAKKVAGKPLYRLARKGIEVERKPSRIEIYKAEIRAWRNPFLEIDLHVSKGTYIRSYAHDLGKKLKVGAVLKELKRTAVEPYTLEESFTIESFQHYWSSLKAYTNGSAQRNR